MRPLLRYHIGATGDPVRGHPKEFKTLCGRWRGHFVFFNGATDEQLAPARDMGGMCKHCDKQRQAMKKHLIAAGVARGVHNAQTPIETRCGRELPSQHVKDLVDVPDMPLVSEWCGTCIMQAHI